MPEENSKEKEKNLPLQEKGEAKDSNNKKDSQNKATSQKFLQVVKLDDNADPPFFVGVPINVEIMKVSIKNKRFNSHILGWQKSRMILIQILDFEDAFGSITPGTNMLVRYIHQGKVFGFETRLVFKQNEPLTGWYLEYPKAVEIINLRKNIRINLNLEITSSEGEVYSSKDISICGAWLITNTSKEKKIGDVLKLSFTLPDKNKITDLAATIIRKSIDKNCQNLGVQFDEANKEEIEKLNNFLKNYEVFYNFY